jgi:hypothetical protein
MSQCMKILEFQEQGEKNNGWNYLWHVKSLWQCF